MVAKAVKISPDNTTYNTLPGSSGSFQATAEAINDTIFGATFQSSEVGLLSWEVSSPAFFKGFAGYLAKILKTGTSTAVTAGPATLAGKVATITDTTKRIIDRSQAVVVYDNAVDETAQVLSIDFLFGKITFVNSYTPTGPITVDYNYFPTVQLGKGQSYTLTMTAAEIDTTDFETAQGNGGYRTYLPGLRTVSLNVGGVFDATVDALTSLTDRDELIVEIDPAGDGSSIARGFFKYSQDQQQGDVGALEAETLDLVLNVPDDDTFTIEQFFSWQHTNTTLSQAVQDLLTSWLNQSLVYVQYLPSGAVGQSPLDGRQGQAIATSMSLKGGLSDMNTFDVTLRGSGAVTKV